MPLLNLGMKKIPPRTKGKILEKRTKLSVEEFNDACSRYGIDISGLDIPYLRLSENSVGLCSVRRTIDSFIIRETIGGPEEEGVLISFRYTYEDCAGPKNESNLCTRNVVSKNYNIYGRLPKGL